jgi:hypothetical protein
MTSAWMHLSDLAQLDYALYPVTSQYNIIPFQLEQFEIILEYFMLYDTRSKSDDSTSVHVTTSCHFNTFGLC